MRRRSDLDHRQRDALSASRRRLGWVAATVVRLQRVFRLSPDSALAAASNLDSVLPEGLRVLVADDNPSNLWNARELLGRWGITPTLAADGAEAVALACLGRFDLILMDPQMPVLDGLAATKRIRAFEHDRSRTHTPVLAYTSQAIDARVLRDCGIDGVLDKPCDPLALRGCLLRWCASTNSADAEFDRPAGAYPQR